ncbi:MAG: hypothetical protein LC104_03420 [Bacteroidales bacterium]|nr:hypothetical protein [Bacteroidales bacterium]
MAARAVNMIMLGPSRVGKSSLLATMYREIGKMKAGFDLMPVDETQDRLDEAYFNLNKVMEQQVFAPVEDLLKGTMDFIEHRFEVKFHQTKEFDLVFHDFRGGAMMRSGPDQDTLREKVARSHVIFNVLDAVSLMEVDAIKGDQRNGHDRVRQLLDKALKPGEKYLIIFVLVKCETYVKTASNRERLVNRFEERHAAVLRLIENLNQTHKNVVGLLVPAITLGCVEFKEIDSSDNYVFERNHRDFEPREVDQPLRYALSFALNHVNENRWIGERIWRYLSGQGRAFDQALKDFYSHRNSSYKTYGNPDLLRVK